MMLQSNILFYNYHICAAYHNCMGYCFFLTQELKYYTKGKFCFVFFLLLKFCFTKLVVKSGLLYVPLFGNMTVGRPT